MKNNKLLQNIKNFAQNVLFTSEYKCIFCEEELFDDQFICNNCAKQLPYVNKTCKVCGEEIVGQGDLCLRCKKDPVKFFDGAFSPFRFEGNIVLAIHNLKYHNQRWIAPYLSKIMFNYFKEKNINVDIVIPVPLNKNRLKERGFNQSYLICKEFENNLIKVSDDVISRVVDTKTQTNLSATQRQENLKNAFEVVNKQELKDKIVLVVDDVYTTGATMQEVCRCIRKCKPSKVYCLTLAHVVNPILMEKLEIST